MRLVDYKVYSVNDDFSDALPDEVAYFVGHYYTVDGKPVLREYGNKGNYITLTSSMSAMLYSPKARLISSSAAC